MRRVKKLMFYMLGSRYQESLLKEYVGGNWKSWGGISAVAVMSSRIAKVD